MRYYRVGLAWLGLYLARALRRQRAFTASSAVAARVVPATTGAVTVPQYRSRSMVEAASGWGWLPALSLVAALGALLVALAYTAARAESEWTALLFWAGLLSMFVPIALRLVSVEASRSERLGLIVLAGIGLYLVKMFHSPMGFTFSDELQHWRTARNISQSGHLFHENPLLPVSPFYPGIETVTNAVVSLTGLTIFGAGVLVVGVARLVLVLVLFLFYEEVSRSARVAGIAALLYMANPNFVFFGAQFGYESLALPFAVLVLFAAARRERAPSGDRLGLTLLLLLALAGTVTTHHLTAYALTIFLGIWTVIFDYRGDGRNAVHDRPGPGGVFFLALVCTITWLVFVASRTLDYLAPNLGSGALELLRLFAGELTARQLFRSFGGQVAPLWEQLTGYAAVILVLIGLPAGLLQVWQRHRASAVALTLAVGGLAYPVSLALRFTPRGAEVSNRASEFLFVAVAFVLAVGIVHVGLAGRTGWRSSVPFAGLAAVIFMGGVIVGWAPWARFPGPYLVSADVRSIEPHGLAAAEWARVFLGPDNRIAADRTNRLLMGSYGEQRPVTAFGDRIDTAAVFFAPEFGLAEQETLRQGRVRYLVVDARLSSGLPMTGVYFEQGEPDTFLHTTPIDPAALRKFDDLESVSRLLDSGDIVVYEVGAPARAR